MQKPSSPGPRKPSPKKSPKKNSAKPEVEEATAQQQTQNVLKHLQPLTDFHQAVEDASRNDVRIYWDVRLVRGEDTPFSHVHGTSSLPAMLAPNMRPNAPSKIQEEATEKILIPLVSAMQAEVQRTALENAAKRRKHSGDGIHEGECSPGKGNEPTGQEKAANPLSPEQREPASP